MAAREGEYAQTLLQIPGHHHHHSLEGSLEGVEQLDGGVHCLVDKVGLVDSAGPFHQLDLKIDKKVNIIILLPTQPTINATRLFSGNHHQVSCHSLPIVLLLCLQ